MKLRIVRAAIIVAASLATVALRIFITPVAAQAPSKDARQERFTPRNLPTDEGPPDFSRTRNSAGARRNSATEAPTGFDNLTNGFAKQGPPFETLNERNVAPTRSFNDARFVFEEVESAANGVGPTYNAQSCRECHQNVVTGGASQVTEHRTGHTFGDEFFEAPGGSLIQSRATSPEMVERVTDEDEIRTFRLSTSILGSGFVECVSNSTLLAIRDRQPEAMRGTALTVSVLEGNGSTRVGRFGWKSQHASLLSFAADAYLNEMGITSPLFPEENTSSGRFAGFGSDYDPLPEPENDGEDVKGFALFMRSTKAPPRGEINDAVIAGERQFKRIGCAICHIPSIRTAPPGRITNGGTFIVPPALGDKIIHPYSDFLLHDIGTGDGIPFLPGSQYASTAHQMRTAPLWGLRTRNRLMHDGLTFTKVEAIERHRGQADSVRENFDALPKLQRNELLAFLESL